MVASFLLVLATAGVLGLTQINRAKARPSLRPVRVRANAPRNIR